jgi:RHH-type proline utilization regulon transcriptional repressor/proline dehydrogenase/delta 1-pyrroline-5-carboxylate dehydrogenase
MKILGQQFVMGETIEAALQRAADAPKFRYSFDMLGEAALTAADAERYFAAYRGAIEALGRSSSGGGENTENPSISVKLSALHPRYELAQGARALPQLVARLLALARSARAARIGLTVDAEEADRLELSLAIFARAFADPSLHGYSGLGIAVQAYQKRARYVLRWLNQLASGEAAGPTPRGIPVRLVKGAYWDSEIKRAQEQGLDDYPVFTQKSHTDVAYLACAKALLLEHEHLLPQFATHNAHTVAWISHVGAGRNFEFQRLHGMGEELYTELLEQPSFKRSCRVYAPVGSHQHLLPYLVRRLLENGANTSFVNRLIHTETAADAVADDPLAVTRARGAVAHPRIPPPRQLFAPERVNSRGLNLAGSLEMAKLSAALHATGTGRWLAEPRVAGSARGGAAHETRDPAEHSRIVGSVLYADAATAREALDVAAEFQPQWSALPAQQRAQILRHAADLIEKDTAQLVARCVAETGRTLADSLAEVREAVDLVRYYAAQCVQLFGNATHLPGPTGERNELRFTGRGVFVCISPWNFPLAIFLGQIAAALAAGNTVLAKPAEQGSLVAQRAVELLELAGVPVRALQFLPGDGGTLGQALLVDPRVAGVAFTGSVETARAINRLLANRRGPLATLIAETGGINAMIVDSSALPEQVVRDVAQSAFNSAGQRCSALRVLCLQDDSADDVLRLLRGWMDELVIGDPALLSTDVGPVIERTAHAMLSQYVESQRPALLHQCALTPAHTRGWFFPPTVLQIGAVTALTDEVFGPVLHVVRYRAEHATEVIDAINASGYGLTLGVHTRIDSFARMVAARARVGNVYVNRNMIGAQVGVQPFGGMGLSGTGPKAGGPHYLLRFANEQTVSTNTAAVGGNASLLALDDAPPETDHVAT